MISKLRNLQKGADENKYSTLIDCLCRWGQVGHVVELICDWISDELTPKKVCKNSCTLIMYPIVLKDTCLNGILVIQKIICYWGTLFYISFLNVFFSSLHVERYSIRKASLYPSNTRVQARISTWLCWILTDTFHESGLPTLYPQKETQPAFESTGCFTSNVTFLIILHVKHSLLFGPVIIILI